VNGLGSAIRDMHSLGQIHSLQVALCLVPEQWPREVKGPGSKIMDSYSSMLEKNSPDSPWLMFLPFEGRCSSRSHRCEWKNGPDDSVYIMILFFCAG
jgi:hypothetical protein